MLVLNTGLAITQHKVGIFLLRLGPRVFEPIRKTVEKPLIADVIQNALDIEWRLS